MRKPFWEKTYKDAEVTTFGIHPNQDIQDMWQNFKQKCSILEVGCGEGKNSLFLAEKGFDIDAIDLSQAGIQKLKGIAAKRGIKLNAWAKDLRKFDFDKSYDVIISYGTLHFVEKNEWKIFIEKAKENTNPGGINIKGLVPGSKCRGQSLISD